MNDRPRGLRNCNPGNIRRSTTRYKGEVAGGDPDFKCFRSAAWGYRAVFVLLHTYRVRYGIDTLRGMIGRWAPPCENDTESYLAAVARRAALDPDQTVDTLDRSTMTPIAAAISAVENGVPASEEEVAEGWRLFSIDF